MKIIRVGDKQKAACNHCESFQTVTFQLRDVPFSDGSGIVKNVLVGVCDTCNLVAVLPHQSTPLVKKQLEKQQKATEIRVPAHMVDILNLAGTELEGGAESVPNLIKYYIHSLTRNEISPQGISEYLKSDLAQGKAQKRISIKGRFVANDLNLLKEITKIKSTRGLIKSIILRINDDILVKKEQNTIKKLKSLLAATA